MEVPSKRLGSYKRFNAEMSEVTFESETGSERERNGSNEMVSFPVLPDCCC